MCEFDENSQIIDFDITSLFSGIFTKFQLVGIRAPHYYIFLSKNMLKKYDLKKLAFFDIVIFS
jgi:hypothetical protein